MLSILTVAVCVNITTVDPATLASFVQRHEQTLTRTGRAIVQQESNGNPKAYCECEDAAGIFQIRPIYVRCINRALGHERYSLADRWDPVRSWEMYMLYMAIHTHRLPDPGPEQFARVHNGGPDGWKRQSTLRYWRDVKRIMQSK